MEEIERESVSADDTIKTLLRNFGIYEELVIEEEEEKIMVIMALTQPDIVAIKIDEEGALCIQYEGENWNNDRELNLDE
jgi:hypothetical protein